MSLQYIHILDRLSRRHKWHVYVCTRDKDRVPLFVNRLIKSYSIWAKKGDFPGYQIGRIDLDAYALDSLPKETLVEVIWDATHDIKG